jgi:hypothetical protein
MQQCASKATQPPPVRCGDLGLVEPAAVTLAGAARTPVAIAKAREGILGRRRAAVDQARSGQLGTHTAAGQPDHLDDPLPIPEPGPDRVADVDRSGRLARNPLICTCPARQACAASERVLASRTVHSQRSILVPSIPDGGMSRPYCCQRVR